VDLLFLSRGDELEGLLERPEPRVAVALLSSRQPESLLAEVEGDLVALLDSLEQGLREPLWESVRPEELGVFRPPVAGPVFAVLRRVPDLNQLAFRLQPEVAQTLAKAVASGLGEPVLKLTGSVWDDEDVSADSGHIHSREKGGVDPSSLLLL